MMTACIQVSSAVPAPPPYDPPVAAFSPGDSTIPAFTNQPFVDESTGNPTQWKWEVNGSTFAITQNANYFFADAGDYTIRLTVTNDYGTDYIEHTITVAGGGVIP